MYVEVADGGGTNGLPDKYCRGSSDSLVWFKYFPSSLTVLILFL